MLVTFVSQCEKKSLKRTRRILDAFANRIGDNVWQTAITEEGLATVKQLLRASATRSTAVSCHRVRTRKKSELVWIVGNRRKFNEVGVVPVNWTDKDEQYFERFALNTQVIALLSSLAGFFHDVGKANILFQNKLLGKSKKLYEPYRHEWISLRVFQAFVQGKDDKTWLNHLATIDKHSETRMLDELDKLKDGITTNDIPQPFDTLPPVARFVAWLIVSHHRLPVSGGDKSNPPPLNDIDSWSSNLLDPCWNSPLSLNDEWASDQIEKNWLFPYGTPLISAHWQTKVSILATRILKHERIFLKCWFKQNYTAHIARLCLMLADHYYSSDKPEIKINLDLQDRNYQAYANTYKDEYGQRQLKQKLDEHNIAVGIFAEKIARLLPSLRHDLPALNDNKMLAQNTKHNDFVWQNEAYALAVQIREDTKKYGFFGICKASTGKGKTLANARIMYGLSDDDDCRFNIALGLRTLTIQTAKALEKDLSLQDGELAMLIGSTTIRQLHQDIDAENIANTHQTSDKQQTSEQESLGSQSSEPLIEDDIEVLQGSSDYSGEFAEWVKHDPKILKLIESPILVSTIDYLTPATEGIRSGRQIAPMLRLLTSDLVLDEPDDFGLDDLPALCRLVNWAGMLGSRVLLSTATMPPSLATALFEAYQSGRKHYTEVNGEQGICNTVCCAWFDEFKHPQYELINNTQAFEKVHDTFIDRRIKQLQKQATPLRQAKLINIEEDIDKTLPPSQWLALHINSSIHELHQQHHIKLANKAISIGLVRMANINPMVLVAKHLLNTTPPNDTVVHYCIYHGQFPLIQRSSIERQLDAALNRKNEDLWIENANICATVDKFAEKNHVFVVLATSVAEVGRDHDYDWAVVEPSSMRSFIQLAGRVQRHRRQQPQCHNIHILSTNYKGLKGNTPNFCKPGFETERMQYSSPSLSDLDIMDDIENISAIPRIIKPDLSSSPFIKDSEGNVKITSFNTLEHLSQNLKLFGSKNYFNHADLWWQHNPSWCGELQKRQPFRQSQPQEDYCLAKPQHVRGLRWQKKMPKTYPTKYELTNDIAKKEDTVMQAKGNVFWCKVDIEEEIEKLEKKLGGNSSTLFKTFTQITLRQVNNKTDEQWLWHRYLGVYQQPKRDRWNHE